MTSYFEHNRREKGEQIAARIAGGEVCALVTDAGMPAISDPGEDLVRLCRDLGLKVEVVPGPTAFVAALALSGMPAGRFTFEGFLSVNKQGRREHLAALKDEERTMVFYEAPHKLRSSLKDFYEALGNREIAIVREVTKIHEEVILTNLKEAAIKYETQPVKGEIVLIIRGKEAAEEIKISLEDATEKAQNLILQGFGLSEAAKTAAKETGYKKGEIYKALAERAGNERKGGV